jgi:hypothetical protein
MSNLPRWAKILIACAIVVPILGCCLLTAYIGSTLPAYKRTPPEAEKSALVATATPQATTAPAPEAAPVPTAQTPEDILRQIALTVSPDSKPEVIAQVQKGSYMIKMAADDGGLRHTFENSPRIRAFIHADSARVYEKAFATENGVATLILFWTLRPDGGGDPAKTMVLTLTRKTGADYKWDEVAVKNLPVLMDDYWQSALYPAP